jgi:hypothetical protein
MFHIGIYSMLDILIFVGVTAATSLYAFLMTAIADQHPEFAGLLALLVAIAWFVLGWLYFF